jgi:hypothetical protein
MPNKPSKAAFFLKLIRSLGRVCNGIINTLISECEVAYPSHR